MCSGFTGASSGFTDDRWGVEKFQREAHSGIEPPQTVTSGSEVERVEVGVTVGDIEGGDDVACPPVETGV